MQYRRAYLPGGSYFFTLVTHARRPILADQVAIDGLRSAFRVVKTKRPFSPDAIVILPDHLHCIWTLPEGDQDYSTRWRLIKSSFTRNCYPSLRRRTAQERRREGGQSVWQKRYWEHLLRDERDYRRHIEYTHYNPVKHGYVSRPGDWPHSSFTRFVRAGIYARDWGTSDIRFGDAIGRE